MCLKFWPVSSSVWPGSPAGPGRETGLEAEIPDLGTEDELEVGTKKFGGFSPPGSTMDIEILGEIDRIRAKLCGNAPGWLAGWLGWAGWAGWLAAGLNLLYSLRIFTKELKT